MLNATWQRIADDLRNTTGEELSVEVRESETEMTEVDAYLNGAMCCTIGRWFPPEGSEQFIVELADVLREDLLDEFIWRG